MGDYINQKKSILIMERGQLMSQPFIYIFAIIVIGLIFVFGFRYIGKIMGAGCEVEVMDLVNDVQAEVNQLRALSFGSNTACTFSYSSASDYECVLVVPSSVKSVCFVDAKRGQENQITERFTTIKNFISEFGSAASGLNKNLFFGVSKDSSCEIEPQLIRNIEIEGPVCLDVTKDNSFIMENSGRNVIIRSG